MEIVKTLELENDLLNYAEYLHYSINSCQQIVVEILTKVDENNKCIYSTENYQHFMDQYLQLQQEMQLLYQQILKNFAPEYVNSPQHSIQFDFFERTAYIYLTDSNTQCTKNGGCGCGGKN